MSTTPLMGMVLPDDHDATESDNWGLILNVALGINDSHNHTPGLGAKVPTGGLKIDADISWSFGGVSRAITDLRALDFSPQPATGMTALAGALFLSDGTSGLSANELYYRTTSGVNVKVTAGSALNIAGFTGGIGGDYAATGALVSYDDATDSYLFKQQVGASVQQYARMQSADLDLFEFKAHPTAGVPTTRVRLQSPAGLAASYALTFPAALPASTKLLQVSSAGVVSASNATSDLTVTGTVAATGAVSGSGVTTAGTVTGLNVTATNNLTGSQVIATNSIGFPATEVYSASDIFPGDSTIPEHASAGNPSAVVLGTSIFPSTCPLRLRVGTTINTWAVQLNKTSATGNISAKLWRESGLTATQIGSTQSNSSNNPGIIFLGQAGLSTVVASTNSYVIEVTGGGITGDRILSYQVFTT